MVRSTLFAVLMAALFGSTATIRGDEPASGPLPTVATVPTTHVATVTPVRWYRGYGYRYPGYYTSPGYRWYGYDGYGYYPGYAPGYYYSTPYYATRPYYYGAPYRGFHYYGPRGGVGVYY